MLKFSRKILWLNLIPVKQFHQAKEGLPKKKAANQGYSNFGAVFSAPKTIAIRY